MLRRFSVILLFVSFIIAVFFFYRSSQNELKNISQASLQPQQYLDKRMSYEKWQDLISKLRYLCESYKGYVGVYLKDLSTSMSWEYNADRLFLSASLIKLPIMISVLDRVEKGEVSLDTEFVITDRERVGGSGSLKWARSGTKITLFDVIYRMITESDNTATRLLIDYFGVEYFKAAFRRMGLHYTNITIEGMDLTSGRVRKENFTTPREMAYLLEKIYHGQMISKEKSQLMIDILKRTKERSRIRKGVPSSWEVGHKTGLLRKSCSDAAIVFSPAGDYILVVLLDDVPNYSNGKNFISKIAKITSEYYKI